MYASVLDVKRCADLIAVCFGVEYDTLCQYSHPFTIQDRTPVRFRPLRLEFQPGMWHRFGLLWKRCDTV